MRLTAKIFLSTIAFISILLALGTYALNQKVGSAENFSSTVSSALKNDGVALGAGKAMVDQLLKDAKPKEVAAINAPRSVLNRAAARAIQKYSDPISVAAGKAYTAVLENQTTRLNVRPALVAVVTSLHAVEPKIPAKINSKKVGIIVIKADTSRSHLALISTLSKVKKLLNMWWLFLLVALGLFVGISVVDKRSGVGAWRWPGYILFLTGGAWLFVASILPKLASSKVSLDKQDAFNSVTQSLDNGLMAVAAGATVVGAVLIVVSFVAKS